MAKKEIKEPLANRFPQSKEKILDIWTKGVPVQVRWGRENPQTISREDLSLIRKIIEDIHQETGNKVEISGVLPNLSLNFLQWMIIYL